jgi:1-acyl-sn-glycerol-3-phosphate acyltransferase
MVVESIPKENLDTSKYDHSSREPIRWMLRFLIRTIGFTLLAKLHRVDGLDNVPATGPAILMINHIAFIDPIVVLHVVPRNIVPLAKIEVYSYPIVGIFPRLWGVIPVRREEVDRRAVQQVQQVLKAGEIVLVAPEGTRSPSLTQGKEGVAYLAVRSGAPIIPVAIDGTIGFPALRFTRAWSQPGAVIKFGRPFRFKSEHMRPDREILRKMTDEAMYILAGALPPHRRGVYADLSRATQETIEWL